MSRPRKCCRVADEPRVTFYKPAGIQLKNLEEIELNIEEFEAIRLKDSKGLDQEMAAGKMNISQPTFHRLITSARKKIADTLVNVKALRIKGGNYTKNENRSSIRQ